MQPTQDQVQEWRSHPITNVFLETIKAAKAAYLEQSRYSPITVNGQPMTADQCALQNAHTQGLIEAFEEVLLIPEELISDDKDSNQA